MGKIPDAAFTYQALVMRSPEANGPDDAFVAIALSMDLLGAGESPEAALETLQKHVDMHVSHSARNDEFDVLERPAPDEYQTIARELLTAFLRGDEPSDERFVRTLLLPSARGAVHRPRARYVSEWSERELARLLAAPIPDEAAAFDDEGDFVGAG